MHKLVLVAALCFFACGGSQGNGDGSTGPVCGDGKKADSEGCDDGNTTPGDGCSASCKEEQGFKCIAEGAPCVKLLYCGDGILTAPEVCDDGNSMGGDGCSGTCQIEQNFTCPMPGQPCVSTIPPVCGNGVPTGGEQCDDHNTTSGDGCSATCTVEDGWRCPDLGGKCAPRCGDGKIVGNEECDLGPDNDQNKGCTKDCTRQQGWVCGKDPSSNVYSCHQTVCGDGKTEGDEKCDDGNLIPFDGCSPTCTLEPVCAGGKCSATCGDGLVFDPEQCDDGNLVDGDGCSSKCMLEDKTVTGFDCKTTNQSPPSTLVIPILYRDMRYAADANGHPDFQGVFSPGHVCLGLVQDQLNLIDSKPIFKDSFGTLTVADGGGPNLSQALSGAADFDCWYRNTCHGGTNMVASRVWLDTAGQPTTLTLRQQTTDANFYVFDNPLFFPIDGLGWNAPGSGFAAELDDGVDGHPHNFSFTSELHYPFTYDASTAPEFRFTGDDDVWVFINGHLAVDLGGVHGATDGSVKLNDVAANLGLVDKGMYSIDMFQAERHTKQSNYHLTLSGFVHASTTCTPICGDGKVAGNEVCDDGPKNGMAGFCNANCTAHLAKCGDGIIQMPEECDNGVNSGAYGTCDTNCKPAAFCGDGTKNGPEQCDNGGANVGLDQYGPGKCTVACTIAPYCGDGIVEAAFGEQCEGGAGCFDCKYAVIN